MMTILDNKRHLPLALALFSSVAALAQAPSQDELAQAKFYADRNLLPAAEAETHRVLSVHPDSADAHFFLGYILFREQKARESLAEYTEGAKYRKPSAADLRVVGGDYVLLNDYEDADKWFTMATQFEPSNVLGWYYLGRTKYNENRFEEAIEAFKKVLALEPRHIHAEDNLGLSYQGLGRMDEARQAFQNAIDWQSHLADKEKDPFPYLDMGSFLLESNRAEEAIPYFKQSLALAPDTPKAHQQLGKAYLALKRFPEAQTELEAAVRLEPNSAPAHYILGQLYQREGQNAKAKEEFAKYQKLNAGKSTETSQ